ncbi:hypothetical protein B0J17DRAFT_633734 [Rhizoctonia solani]|nr:hypothetical protein B0J17DRAFT_633734 [Rhizoctonia solani]
MYNRDDTTAYLPWNQEAHGILRWLGADNTRNDIAGQPLQRWPNESSYHYFSRWLQSYGVRLEWSVEFFPQGSADKCILWRPIVNGLELPACSVAFGASFLDEYRAKEDACEALVAAYRCFARL